jgi:hypothetical protein
VRVRRRRRRILGAVLVVAYLAAFAWLTLPLWRPADAATPASTPLREVKSNGSVGLPPLADAKPLPTSLPGSSSTKPSESGTEEFESGGEEVFSEGEVEATGTPETSEAPPSTSSSGSGSSSSSETIIGGEG